MPAAEVFFKEDPKEKKKVALQTTLKASQAESIVEGFDDVEEHIFNQHDNILNQHDNIADQHDIIPNDLDDPYESTPEDDVVPMHSP